MHSNQPTRAQKIGGWVALLIVVAVVAAIAVGIIAVADNVSSNAGKQAGPARTVNRLCLSNAPGGRLCGADAKSFCQSMAVGQTVAPGHVDRLTIRQCAALGVRGLR